MPLPGYEDAVEIVIGAQPGNVVVLVVQGEETWAVLAAVAQQAKAMLADRAVLADKPLSLVQPLSDTAADRDAPTPEQER
ncbi:hypothetical protein [Actinocrispum wychmicini]|uniref:Uncharacterized protein n=1 Tax=Actinocrispum wychmicini TaxID=1213861 RepID=A0A4R2IHL4_9PSEU|nr:hypothetical protein [Actinocrispum wychmicini]TCO43742.1 hypothetical protein EV192_1285 [Actinocrispum wychmicini]